MKNDINITSTVLEKGIEVAKEFLDKLIMPAVEETGLLLREKVTYWKFKNQVKILNKAKDYCEKHGIEPKTISFKLLVPLIETSALEEDEVLQDKWAILLSNMVDSEQNIENHVFPYILGQLSTNEFLFIEQVYLSKVERIDRLRLDLEKFKINLPSVNQELKEKIQKIADELKQKKEEKSGKGFLYDREIWDLENTKRGAERQLKNLDFEEGIIVRKMCYPETIPEGKLKEYELSNLIRLGLVKEVQETTANPQTLEIPKHEDSWNNYVTVDVDIEIESNIECKLTELGELFMNACSEKRKNCS